MRANRPQRGSKPRFLHTLVAVSSLLHAVNAHSVVVQDETPSRVSEFVKRADVTASGLPDNVEAGNIFENPLGDNKHHFEEHHDNNHKGAKDPDPGKDAFSFFAVDGTKGAVYNDFANTWYITEQHSEKFKLSKRAWDHVRRADIPAPKDTFEPLQETYKVTCPAGMNAESCKEIFIMGAKDTIIKLPNGVGMGPYARIVSFEPVSKAQAQLHEIDRREIQRRREQLLARRQTEGGSSGGAGVPEEPIIYNLVTDYDFQSIDEQSKPGAAAQFRCDFSNLVDYWEQVVKAPPSASEGKLAKRESGQVPELSKRWWGAFINWLTKVTTLSKSDEGNLEAKFARTWNLIHAEKHCATEHTTLDAKLDLDASVDLGMHSHYSYLLSGHFLPLPKVDKAFGYFSIEPYFNLKLVLEGHGSFVASTGEHDLLPIPITFPGLSIKGIMRIGPELAVKGSITAEIDVSGKVEAGVNIKFPKAAVAYPQNFDGYQNSIAPKGPGKDGVQNTKVEPILNAQIDAQAIIDFTATPKLSFGVEVFNKLVDGDVYLGVENTIQLGVSADAQADINTGASAEFCYWSDYKYRVFIGAEFKAFSYDWNTDEDLVTPDEPIEILPRTCKKYSTSSASKKRATLPSKAENEPSRLAAPADKAKLRQGIRDKLRARALKEKRQSAKKGIFDGVFSCPVTEKPPADPCAHSVPNDSFVKRDLDETLSWIHARAPQNPPTPAGGAPAAGATCKPPPTLFYNCDHFRNSKYGPNNDKDAKGICENVKEGIQKRAQADSTNFDANGKWALLHYVAGTNSGNRADACGGNGDTSTKGCRRENEKYWTGTAKDGKTKSPDKTKKEARWLSCDEFPFNSSKEGGVDTVTACVSQIQQNMQGVVSALIKNLKYDGKTFFQWSRGNDGRGKGGFAQQYRLVLFEPSSSSSTNTVGGPSSVAGVDQIIGAVNMWKDPKYGYTSGKNGVCFDDPDPNKLEFHKSQLLWYRKFSGCTVTFANGGSAKVKRANGTEPVVPEGVNMNDPSTWGIVDVQIDHNDPIDPFEVEDRLGGLEDLTF